MPTSISIGNGVGVSQAGGTYVAPVTSYYLRPDGVSKYLRPDGVSRYQRP